MVIYEVNLDVPRELADEFARLLGPHMDQMLRFEGFLQARWYERREDSTKSTVCWTTHYELRSRSDLEHYFEQHAAEMRADGVNRFGNRFSASRRILESVEEKQ